MPLNSPRLWVIATPIGNPGDLSPRARHILESADVVLAEDTRLAAKLFRECNLAPRSFTSFFEHNEDEKKEEVLDILRKGGNVALVSDAGTPLLSDPGFRLVTACRKENIAVSPIPGPSAPIAALSAAGIPPVPFSFLGFLPRDRAGKKKLFQKFANVPGSLSFFERKDRLGESLAVAHEILGARKVAICREITKEHEEFILGDLANSANLANNLLGEITVLIGPCETEIRASDEEAEAKLLELIARGKKTKDAAKLASQGLTGWSARELYNLYERLKSGREKN